MKKFFTLIAAAMMAAGAWATDTNYSPTAEYNVRPAADGTKWTTSPTAGAASAKKEFELKAQAAFYAIQQFTVANIQDASQLVLQLTNGSGSDALAIWAFKGTFSEDMTASDFNTAFEATTGVKPGQGGTSTATYLLVNTTSIKNPTKFTISGTALTQLKSMATSEGVITLLITNKTADIDGNTATQRKYLSSNSDNDEASRPVLTVTTPDPVKAVDYWTLTANFKATQSKWTSTLNDKVLEVVKGEGATQVGRGDVKNTTDTYRLDANKVLFIEVACTADGAKTNASDRKVGYTALVSAVDATTPIVMEQFVGIESVALSNGHELIYFNMANTAQYGLEKTPVIYKQGDSANKFTVEQKTAAGEAIAAQQSMELSNVGFTLISLQSDGKTRQETNFNIYNMGSAKDVDALAKEYGFTPTAISNVNADVNANADKTGVKKVMKAGRIVISNNGAEYTVAGARIK